jgi:hypothetical protein
MSVSSEQAVAVLAKHQRAAGYAACVCGAVVAAHPWQPDRSLAEHQVAELAKAGIFPFRVPSSP